MRRRSLFTQGSEDLPLDSISPADSVAGDYAFYDKTADKIIIIDQTKWSVDKYPSNKYTPIGIVVVPGTHNVYGDGSCGVMSLKEMNYSTPDTGSTSYQYMYWGHYGNDISNLPNLDQFPVGNTSNGIPTSQTSYAFIPSDKFSGVQCAHDTDAYYYSSSYSYAPSPYLTDGSRNPGYYQTTSPSSSSNALADFDGKGNSEILWGLATAQSNWRTASTITNNSGDNYLPAACCCWRYHTDGTQQGDWYLPAMGELGYIMPPFNRINEAITKMRNAYGSSVGVTLRTLYGYWSSSEYDSNHAHCVDTDYGYVSGYGKDNDHHVRAWLRVK